MKRVAICLKGAISKKGGEHQRFYKENDLYVDGDYIDYISVSNSIDKHIIGPNPDLSFDFFIHSWNYDLKDKILEIYNPKKFLFEDNRNYNRIINNIISNESDFGGVSGSLSLKKSLELKEIYEIENNFNYDIIIIYRYDVLLWKDMDLNIYDTDKYIYVNAWDGSCTADYHFVMSNHNSYKFKYLYDSVYLQNNKHEFHKWIKNFIINIIKCDLREDNIIAGIHQEHMRVLWNKNKNNKNE